MAAGNFADVVYECIKSRAFGSDQLESRLTVGGLNAMLDALAAAKGDEAKRNSLTAIYRHATASEWIHVLLQGSHARSSGYPIVPVESSSISSKAAASTLEDGKRGDDERRDAEMTDERWMMTAGQRAP